MKQRSEPRREAERYLWHLRPQWQGRFNHDHWWSIPPADISPEAALWEALRRHPGVERLLEGSPRPGRYDDLLTLPGFLGRLAHKAWPDLRSVEQRMFLTR